MSRQSGQSGDQGPERSMLGTLLLLALVAVVVAVAVLIVKEMSQPPAPTYTPTLHVPASNGSSPPEPGPAATRESPASTQLDATRPATRTTPGERRVHVAATRAEIAKLTTALDLFQLDNGRYPTSAEGLGALVSAPAGLQSWRGPYVIKLEKDAWGHEYEYKFPGIHNADRFDVYSRGPTGREEDWIGNWPDRKESK